MVVQGEGKVRQADTGDERSGGFASRDVRLEQILSTLHIHGQTTISLPLCVCVCVRVGGCE